MTDLTLRPGAGTTEVKGRSLWANARHRFMKNKAAVAGLLILVIVAVACFAAPYLGLRDQDDINYDMMLAAPDLSQGYLFGTDSNGRDVFVRTLYGGQVSLTVGIISTFVSLVIGTLYGATAGFLGGRTDGAMMRLVDMLYSIPFIFFVILLTVFFTRNIVMVYVAIGAVNWLDMARIVRGQ
ncbi:MAG TPA: peptide ABC transporter permease, partial [Dongiaceae bacterium]